MLSRAEVRISLVLGWVLATFALGAVAWTNRFEYIHSTAAVMPLVRINRYTGAVDIMHYSEWMRFGEPKSDSSKNSRDPFAGAFVTPRQ